jgi:hypothetical protein
MRGAGFVSCVFSVCDWGSLDGECCVCWVVFVYILDEICMLTSASDTSITLNLIRSTFQAPSSPLLHTKSP